MRQRSDPTVAAGRDGSRRTANYWAGIRIAGQERIIGQSPKESHYVTLGEVAAIIRAGDEVQVLHKDTGRDLTAATMALILFEEERRGPRLEVAGLRKIIQTGRIS